MEGGEGGYSHYHGTMFECMVQCLSEVTSLKTSWSSRSEEVLISSCAPRQSPQQFQTEYTGVLAIAGPLKYDSCISFVLSKCVCVIQIFYNKVQPLPDDVCVCVSACIM